MFEPPDSTHLPSQRRLVPPIGVATLAAAYSPKHPAGGAARLQPSRAPDRVARQIDSKLTGCSPRACQGNRVEPACRLSQPAAKSLLAGRVNREPALGECAELVRDCLT